MKIFNKINLGEIVLGHIKTLINDNDKKMDFDDIFTFVVIPIIFAFLMTVFDINIAEEASTIIITALSIFVGLLFNVIVLLFDILKRDNSNKTKNEVLKQLLTNISFTICLSILIILLSLINLSKIDIIVVIVDGIIYGLLALFFFTLLMVLKRMYALFMNEMKELEKVEKAEQEA